jgi:hypothetical protein
MAARAARAVATVQIGMHKSLKHCNTYACTGTGSAAHPRTHAHTHALGPARPHIHAHTHARGSGESHTTGEKWGGAVPNQRPGKQVGTSSGKCIGVRGRETAVPTVWERRMSKPRGQRGSQGEERRKAEGPTDKGATRALNDETIGRPEVR